MIRFAATWTAAALLSAIAAAVVAIRPTPIDAALPLIVVLLTAVAAVSHPMVQLSVPILIGTEIAVADEKQRLILFGFVAAIALGAAVVSAKKCGHDPRDSRCPHCLCRVANPYVVTIAAIVLLRWIPISEVSIGRETAILAIAGATVFVLRGAPASIAIAVAAALFTPAFPLRTLAIPVGVLALAALARLAGATRPALVVPSAALLATMLIFFPWSGAFARALPIMLRGGPPEAPRIPLEIALAAGESAEVDIPANGRSLILSGANVPRLREGTVVGSIEPGNRSVRIGDVADWGFLRREHYYGARNPLPRRPGGLVRGYGQTSWIDGAGRVEVRPGRVVVTADRTLPSRATLQIVAIELAE